MKNMFFSTKYIINALSILSNCLSASFHEENTNVINLTQENFEATVLGSAELWLVEFYAPWCGHCKRLTPEWNAAADFSSQEEASELPMIKFGAVDATVERNLAKRFKIRGYPSIKVFGRNKNKPTDYKGKRDAGALMKDGKRMRANMNKVERLVKEEEIKNEEL